MNVSHPLADVSENCCPWPPPPPLFGFPSNFSLPGGDQLPAIPGLPQLHHNDGSWPTPGDVPLPSMFPLPPSLLPMPPFCVPPFMPVGSDAGWGSSGPVAEQGSDAYPPRVLSRRSVSCQTPLHSAPPREEETLHEPLKKPSQPPLMKPRDNRATKVSPTKEEFRGNTKSAKTHADHFESVYRSIRPKWQSRPKPSDERRPVSPTSDNVVRIRTSVAASETERSLQSSRALKDELLRLETRWQQLEGLKRDHRIVGRTEEERQGPQTGRPTASPYGEFHMNRDRIMALINERSSLMSGTM